VLYKPLRFLKTTGQPLAFFVSVIIFAHFSSAGNENESDFWLK